ncbi:MAG: hypothetical protein QG610_2307 [Euryarchaeota archaeon]|nr:hypothetical protein [Euryarchaeota archaeon]
MNSYQILLENEKYRFVFFFIVLFHLRLTSFFLIRAWLDFIDYVVGPLTGVRPLSIFPRRQVDLRRGRAMVGKEYEMEDPNIFFCFLSFMEWQGSPRTHRYYFHPFRLISQLSFKTYSQTFYESFSRGFCD